MLNNKNILFIGPVFHDYHLLITENLRSMGGEVTFYPERSYGNVFKLINNFFNNHLKDYQKKHYNKLFAQIGEQKFDYLFVVRGYMMPDEFLLKFRQLNPDAKLIMYQWDSERANPFAHLLKYFNDVYSFDFEDCYNYPTLKYIPLFFSNDIKDIITDKSEAKYDFFFMGWFFPERYQAVLKFKQYAMANGFALKAFLYMPLSSYIKAYLTGEKLDRTVISLKRMKRKEYLSCLRDTRVMVDVSNPNQTGLAMRVIEALASNTKILTNNHKIKDDIAIYNEDAIAFFDESAPIVEKSFLLSKINTKRTELLPLDGWLKLIFKFGEN